MAQPFLYGFSVQSEFVCQSYPCPHTLECGIAHAQEKSAFLLIMFTASCVSLLLNLIELVYVLATAARKRRSNNSAEDKSEVEERGGFLTRLLSLWHSRAALLGSVQVHYISYPTQYDTFSSYLATAGKAKCT